MLKSLQGPAQGQAQRRAPAPRRLLEIVVAALAASALALSLGLAAVAPAAADSAPPEPADPANPATVTADALPTVQIDGVVWQQVVVGNTVYAAGSFGTARPAGSPAGTNTVVRRNILAYNLTTGELLPFAPALNAQAFSIAASPDGSRIYVGGDFTTVNGANVWRVAALDPGTGAPIPSFLPKVAASVRAIVPTAGTVYLGGLFTAVGSATRSRLAAVQATNGALTAWAPSAEGGRVNALALSPDGTRMVVGGAFTTLNGSANPGYGLAAVDTLNGGLLPWAANGRVRDAGLNSAITSLSGDADNVYATGYVFGTGGNLEGTVAAGWNGGQITWLEDCHGDTYAVYPAGDVIYKVGHAHYCGNVGGYPQTEPWGFQRGLAFSKAATGTIIRDPLGYPNWAGLPSPSLLNWFPALDTGTYTGQNQGAWAVTGNGQYVVLGGEFTTVNGTRQQGLVRFAVQDLAPNTRGPVLSGARSNPTLSSPAAGTVRVRWQANHDPDNVRLTYRVIRDGITAAPAYTVTQDSTFWKRPGMSYLDSGLVPGQTYRYRIFVTDALGNESRSDTVSITAAASTPASGYASAIQADRPGNFWRFNDTSGPTLVDSAGAEDLAAAAGAGLRGDGAVVGESTGAGTFDGTGNGVAANNAFQRAPDVFTAEAWVRTSSTSGGKIIGFGNVASGTSRVTDRNVYMDDAGRIYFGLWNGAVRSINSGTGFNDGQWHLITASLSGGGMFLYIDGARAAFRTDVTSGRVFDGYWRIGSDLVGTWPSQPSSGSLKADIDEVALYPAALGLQQVQNHYRASGRTLTVPATPPTAAFTSSIAYLSLSADASGSSDPNGPVASYSWAYGDGSTGTGVTTQHAYAAAGSYTVRLTVTDGDGNSASTTRTVTATAPPGNQPPVAAFTSTMGKLTAVVDASASADPDGTIASYAWDFGDSATGTGKTASHSYASGGTYQVALTVTDNSGAASTSTRAGLGAAEPAPGRTVHGHGHQPHRSLRRRRGTRSGRHDRLLRLGLRRRVHGGRRGTIAHVRRGRQLRRRPDSAGQRRRHRHGHEDGHGHRPAAAEPGHRRRRLRPDGGLRLGRGGHRRGLDGHRHCGQLCRGLGDWFHDAGSGRSPAPGVPVRRLGPGRGRPGQDLDGQGRQRRRHVPRHHRAEGGRGRVPGQTQDLLDREREPVPDQARGRHGNHPAVHHCSRPDGGRRSPAPAADAGDWCRAGRPPGEGLAGRRHRTGHMASHSRRCLGLTPERRFGRADVVPVEHRGQRAGAGKI